MKNFFLILGVCAVICQNLVFWQVLLPEKMQQNQVCVEIMQTMNPASSLSMQHHMMAHSPQSPEKKPIMKDCHFCHLFHNSLAAFIDTVQLIATLILVKLLCLSIAAYICFYLRRLFLCPQGRAPPTIFVSISFF